jgi:GT2 family glycosyltransferase
LGTGVVLNIGYVCTNYNNSAFTCDAIRSLQANVGHRFHVVVVDNNSDPDSVLTLQRFVGENSGIEVVFNAENIGYFRGLNVGIRKLRIGHPELDAMIVGNNDLTFPPTFGDSIEANSDKLRVYPVISPNIITLDGVHQNPHVIRRIGKVREITYDLYFSNYHLALLIRWLAKVTERFTDRDDETQHHIAQPIYQGHGACYVLGPLFFKHFTELWAPTFLMGEEYFLSKQLADKGMQVFYEPSIIVQHHCHAAIAKIPSRTFWEISRHAHKMYRQHVRIID